MEPFVKITSSFGVTGEKPSCSGIKQAIRSVTLDLGVHPHPSINTNPLYLPLQFIRSKIQFHTQHKALHYKMDDVNSHFKSKKEVFVTVGTTSFDSLVRAVDSDQVKEALLEKGYTHLVIQMGRGSFVPRKSSGEDGSLVVDYFTFSSSIADYLRSASLVISHAGSGSIFETLRMAKPLIVVVNEDLMDNHQSELAEELAERKHLFCARPQTLCEVIKSLSLDIIVPYEPGDANTVAKLINKHLGFPVD
ncbi:hypothetical protein QVD17_19305 [Tagetes erecta]|uniref:Glycosyl transferase family 28 C-terminal domain-containing protein n=1 Tax=Tagetes erecta TaxID=13708 RepID=A0AAD8NX58_TARER|nr:hypothetical protein QVD17_19305 [Tagetes erecta]